MRPPVQFGEIGQALYGSHWQFALAEALDVTVRTVQRYAAGEEAVPPERWEQIVELMRSRQACLSELLARIFPPPPPPAKRRSEPERWRIEAWAKAVGISRAHVYKLMERGDIRTAKISASRFILESPHEFLERHSVDGGG